MFNTHVCAWTQLQSGAHCYGQGIMGIEQACYFFREGFPNCSCRGVITTTILTNTCPESILKISDDGNGVITITTVDITTTYTSIWLKIKDFQMMAVVSGNSLAASLLRTASSGKIWSSLTSAIHIPDHFCCDCNRHLITFWKRRHKLARKNESLHVYRRRHCHQNHACKINSLLTAADLCVEIHCHPHLHTFHFNIIISINIMMRCSGLCLSFL